MTVTSENFDEEVAKLMKDVHPTLSSVLQMNAYERGHSSGYEDTYWILVGLVEDFKEVNRLLVGTS